MNSTVLDEKKLEEIVSLLKEAKESLFHNSYAKNKINEAIKKIKR